MARKYMSRRFGPINGSLENEYVLLTIGHSTRSVEELKALLLAHGVARLVDVRTVPRSRYNPQFNSDTLPEALAAEDILYTHLPGLGGLRHPNADSPNSGWHNESFRGFADYMQTEEFAENIEKLMTLGNKERIAVMCAEALPWRCHRSLIADALVVRGISVAHIMGRSKLVAHELTSFARIKGTTIVYPAEEQREDG